MPRLGGRRGLCGWAKWRRAAYRFYFSRPAGFHSIGAQAKKLDATVWHRQSIGLRPGGCLRISAITEAARKAGIHGYGESQQRTALICEGWVLRMPRISGPGLHIHRRNAARPAEDSTFRVRQLRSRANRPNAALHRKSNL